MSDYNSTNKAQKMDNDLPPDHLTNITYERSIHSPDENSNLYEPWKPEDPIYPEPDLSNRFFNEASRIIQIDLEKDTALSEKEKTVEDAMETIDNLQKNILHLQTEYEQLHQNYQKEISYREELLKRTDTTRSMIESAAHYSNILATSIKQIEEDKFKIAEFYNEIYKRQEEIEGKRRKLELLVEEQDDFIKNRVIQMAEEKEKIMSNMFVLNKDLSDLQNTLKNETAIRTKREEEAKKFQDEVEEVKFSYFNERARRIKYQNIYMNLRKSVAKQKTKRQRMWKTRKLIYRKKAKSLKSQIHNLRQTIEFSEKSASKYLVTIEELKEKLEVLEKDFSDNSEKHIKEINNLREKLQLCLKEKDCLESEFNQLRKEMEEGTLRNNSLAEDYDKLVFDLNQQKLSMIEKERELKNITTENLDLKKNLEILTNDMEQKMKIINDYETLKSNEDEFIEKIKNLENEIGRQIQTKEKLENEMKLVKDNALKESSENMNIIFQQKMDIGRLKDTVKALEEHKEFMENKLRDASSELAHRENEMKLQSDELKSLTFETASHSEILEELKKSLQEEKSKTELLLQNIKKLEQENNTLERNLTQFSEREKSLNETLKHERDEAGKALKKLREEYEQEVEIRRSEKDKLEQAAKESLELKKRSEELRTSEVTIKQLKKSLDSAEANVEAYKVIVKKLESEAEESQKLSNELRNEIMRLREMNEKIDPFDKLLTDSQQKSVQRIDEPQSSNGKSDAPSTPPKPTSRRIFSTPKRLQEMNRPNKFKAFKPAKKNRDPYEFDSDSSVERFDSDQVVTAFQSAKNIDNLPRKRRK